MLDWACNALPFSPIFCVDVCYPSHASLSCLGVTTSESALVSLYGGAWHWVLAFSCFDHEFRGALYHVMLVVTLLI